MREFKKYDYYYQERNFLATTSSWPRVGRVLHLMSIARVGLEAARRHGPPHSRCTTRAFMFPRDSTPSTSRAAKGTGITGDNALGLSIVTLAVNGG